MIKAVIFDMDGLIIDSEPFWRESEISVFKKNGIELTEDECRKTTGMRIDEVVKYWSRVYPQANLNVDNIVREIMEEMVTAIKKHGSAMPGLMALIEFFKNKNIPMALASASQFILINAVVEKLKLHHDLNIIESAENMQYGKPHPEIFISTAKKLHVEPENCLVFEDSIFGVLAGKAARMKVIAVPELINYNKREYAIADFKIASLEWFNSSIFDQLN